MQDVKIKGEMQDREQVQLRCSESYMHMGGLCENDRAL